MMDVQSGIYLITCIPTGKVYVGQSLDMKSRWGEHRSLLIRGKHDNGYLQRAWNKHGSDGFTFAILEEVEPGRLIEREAFHAERLRAFDRKQRPKTRLEPSRVVLYPFAQHSVRHGDPLEHHGGRYDAPPLASRHRLQILGT